MAGKSVIIYENDAMYGMNLKFKIKESMPRILGVAIPVAAVIAIGAVMGVAVPEAIAHPPECHSHAPPAGCP